MKSKKIIITGATGFLGTELSKHFSEKGYDVISFSRNPIKSKQKLPFASEHFEFNPLKPNSKLKDAVDGADAVINLAGAGIGDKRWTKSYKELVLNSRIDSTNYIVELIRQSKNPPMLLNASAIGYYGDCGDTLLNEDSPKGSGFLSDVTYKWEAKASEAQDITNVAAARIGIVLDKNGGALKRMLLPFKLFAGGPLGSGRQFWSWIHLSDVLYAFDFIIENKLSGPVNIVSPNPIRMKAFAKELGRAMKRPSFLPVPAFALKIILGESAEMVLNSQKVLPNKLTENGYNFKYSELSSAMKDIFQ